jgi:NADPH2:quinone reductase
MLLVQAISFGGPDAAADGAIRPVIGQEFPLAAAAAAHAALESRTAVAKTLLRA